jgi:hypothetical protein
VLVPRYKLSLCHTPIKPDLLGFQGNWCLCAWVAWPRDQEVRINEFFRLINILYRNFVCEWWDILPSLVLQKNWNDLSKNNWLLSIILILLVHKLIFVRWGFLFSIVLVPRYKLPLCYTPIKPDLLCFSRIWCLCVWMTWSRDHKVRIKSSFEKSTPNLYFHNHLVFWGNDTVQPCDTTQARSYSDFGVKFSIVRFYVIKHNSKSNRCIELKLYQKILEVFVYVGVHFQVNQSLERTYDIGQNRLYEFCYLLHFNLWTSNLARILFLRECGSLFWEFSSSTRIFNELKHNFKSGNNSLMLQNPFLIRISYSS